MAAGTAAFKRIIQLLEKWPLDKNKPGRCVIWCRPILSKKHTFIFCFRDLGESLRSSINNAYKHNKFESNHKYWDRQYFALQRLIDNEHCNKYQRSLSSSATGLTAVQCNFALSKEFLSELDDENKGFLSKIFNRKK